MSEFLKGLIPLSEINEDPQHINGPSVRFAVTFPGYVPTTEIGVNLRRISLLNRIGGIHRLTITSSEESMREESVPLVAGFDSRGNAVAARGGKQTMDPTYTKNGREIRTSSDIPFQATWLESRINLNIDEICNRINVQERVGGLRSAENWTLELDKAVREGIRSMGASYLISGLKKDDWINAIGWYLSIAIGLSAALLLEYSSFGGELIQSPLRGIVNASSLLGGGAFGSLARSLEWKKRRIDTDLKYRHSFIYGPQLDRAILLNVLSSFRGAIQVIK